MNTGKMDKTLAEMIERKTAELPAGDARSASASLARGYCSACDAIRSLNGGSCPVCGESLQRVARRVVAPCAGHAFEPEHADQPRASSQAAEASARVVQPAFPAAQCRAVSPDDIPAAADKLLINWADWSISSTNSSYPSRSAGFATGGASSVDAFDDLCSAVDARVAQVSDAIIDLLPEVSRRALDVWYCSKAYRYQEDVLPEVVTAAELFLEEAKRRGIA